MQLPVVINEIIESNFVVDFVVVVKSIIISIVVVVVVVPWKRQFL